MLKLERNNNNFEIITEEYNLKYSSEKPLYANLCFKNKIGSNLFIASGCDRDELIDELILLSSPVIEESDGVVKIIFEGKTTLWDKIQYIFECYEKKVIYRFIVYGTGSIDVISFFEGFEFDNPNVKGKYKPIFCGPSRLASHHRPKKFFASSSEPQFDVVYTSSINSTDTRYSMYYENSRIGIGDRFYYGGDWLVTPPPYLYLLGPRSKDAWVSAGLLVEQGEYNFMFYEYKGGEGFGFNIKYDGYTSVDGEWKSPGILFEASEDIYTATEKYCDYLRKNGYAAENDRSNVPAWWNGPIFGGWGEQVYNSRHWEEYWTSNSFGWSGGGADACTQEAYTKMLDKLEEKGVDPTILIVDNRWFSKKNHLKVDEEMWPDMKAWIKQQHDKNRKVILWISPFSYSSWHWGEEVPLSEHIRVNADDKKDIKINTDVFYPFYKNKSAAPKRKVKTDYEYNESELYSESRVDVLNPNYRKRILDRVEYLLSPNGLDADGFEFDYTHFIPFERGFKPSDGVDHVTWGAEMVHELLALYYEAAKKAKSDALVISHTFNPYFNDIVDMLRMQDIYTDNDSIVEQMTHRAKMAQISCPGVLIHTDQHPMPSLKAWREYAKFQPKIGNPCLYYVTGIETTYEPFENEDFDLLKRTWSEHRESYCKR